MFKLIPNSTKLGINHETRIVGSTRSNENPVKPSKIEWHSTEPSETCFNSTSFGYLTKLGQL